VDDAHVEADDYSSLPGEHVSINQIVAYNMAKWRKVAGLTQEQLGERLGGWSKVIVSAAERSWDGKRVRQFTADDIVEIARNLGVPIAALFLPPEDDGITKRYLYHPPGNDCLIMASLFALVMSDPTDDDTPEMSRYRERYTAAANRYLDPGRGAELATYLDDLTTAEQLASRLERLQWQRGALAALVDDIDRLGDALVDRLHELPDGKNRSGS
jgi:transcriptional regulator with XRE-family HTH domain